MDKNQQQLEERVKALEKIIADMQNSNTIPYTVDNSFIGRGFMKITKPPIYFVGADQGAWINGASGMGMAFPEAMGQIDQGPLAGFWVPLYIPPRAII